MAASTTTPRLRQKSPGKPSGKVDPDKLVRQEAGTYRTTDGRFVVRSDRPGAWYVTDGHRVDGFGLELTLGPVGTKAASERMIAAQRAEPRGTDVGTVPEVPLLSAPPKKEAKPIPRGKVEPSIARQPEPQPSIARQPEPQPTIARQPEPQPVRVVHARRRRTSDERDAVADVFKTMTEAWTNGRPEEMEQHLHPSVITLRPASRVLASGRKAELSSYSNISSSSCLVAYEQPDLTVDAWGDTAVVTCRFSTEWETDGVLRAEAGNELVVFSRVGGYWLVVWRQVTTDP